MSTQAKTQILWWAALIGPLISILTVGIGIGGQMQTINELTSKVDKLYDVLIYPNVNHRPGP